MTFTDYLFNIALVSLVVVQIRGHKITVARLLFPIVAVAYVATQYLHSVPTAGNDLLLEVGLAGIGCALGVLAGFATSVRSVDGGAFAKAGAVAAVLWVLGIGARMAFEIWVTHGGAGAVGRFSIAHHITSAQAWTTAFVLMALVEVVSRTALIGVKALRTGQPIPRGGFLRRPVPV